MSKKEFPTDFDPFNGPVSDDAEIMLADPVTSEVYRCRVGKLHGEIISPDYQQYVSPLSGIKYTIINGVKIEL